MQISGSGPQTWLRLHICTLLPHRLCSVDCCLMPPTFWTLHLTTVWHRKKKKSKFALHGLWNEKQHFFFFFSAFHSKLFWKIKSGKTDNPCCTENLKSRCFSLNTTWRLQAPRPQGAVAFWLTYLSKLCCAFTALDQQNVVNLTRIFVRYVEIMNTHKSAKN